jgi:hypothetical protein
MRQLSGYNPNSLVSKRLRRSKPEKDMIAWRSQKEVANTDFPIGLVRCEASIRIIAAVYLQLRVQGIAHHSTNRLPEMHSPLMIN